MQLPGYLANLLLVTIVQVTDFAAGQPNAGMEPWRLFNQDLTDTSRRELLAVIAELLESNASVASEYSLNDLLADGLQAKLDLNYNYLQLDIGVIVWDGGLPEPYDAIFPRAGSGIMPYNQCLMPPIPLDEYMLSTRDQARYQPCEEGGSVYALIPSRLPGRGRVRKKLFVLYTPSIAYSPAMMCAALAAADPQSQVPDIFLLAMWECQIHVYRSRINLRHYAQCILSHMRHVPLCSPVRGMAVVPELAPVGGHHKPGYSSPPGRIYVGAVVLAPEYVADGLGEIKVWVIMNAPIAWS